MFVLAHPLHTHRSPDGAGKQGCVRGGVFMAVAAVAAGAVHVDGADIAVLHGKHGRKLQAEIVRGLAGRPASELAIFKLRDSTRWAYRAMSVDGEVVGGADPPGGLLESLLGVANVAGYVVLVDLGGADKLPELALIRQAFPSGPGCLEIFRGANGAPFPLGDHAQEIALADHLDQPGDVLDRALVDTLQTGADGGRAHHAAMQHAGQLEIVYVGKLARHFGRNVIAGNRLSNDFVVRWIFERRLLVEFQGKILSADQLRIGHLLCAAAQFHRGLLDDEIAGGRTQLLCGFLQQGLPGSGSGLVNLRAASLDRETSPRLALRGRKGCVALDDIDARQRNVQLLGHDLGQGRAYTGAHLHFAGVEGHMAAGVDGEEGIHLVESYGLGRGCALSGGCPEGAWQGKADDQDAGAFQEIAASWLVGEQCQPCFKHSQRRA